MQQQQQSVGSIIISNVSTQIDKMANDKVQKDENFIALKSKSETPIQVLVQNYNQLMVKYRNELVSKVSKKFMVFIADIDKESDTVC